MALKCGTCLIFLETLLIIVQSGLKLYDFTALAAQVEAEQDYKSVRTTVSVIMCLFNQTEDRI